MGAESNGESHLPISVVLVDDHELVRQGAKNVLQRDAAFKVIGEAADSPEAIELITDLRPDVVVVDIRLKDGSGLDVVRAQKRVAPETKCLILSAFDDEQYVRPLLRMGVHGYLVKTATSKEFKRAVMDVADGNIVFPAEIAGTVLGVMQSDKSSPQGQLTSRENQVLQLMGEGMTNREISEELKISMKTVEAHVQNLLHKLGVSSRTQAVATALRGEFLT